MSPTAAPYIRELTSEESYELLRGQHVGRLAFTLHDRVDIEPLGYVSEGEWIFGRTSEGTKLSRLLHHPWCAFETDVVHDQFEWSSVVVKGTFYLLDPEIGSPDTYRRAAELLSTLVPGTFTTKDPAPQRSIVFGIYIREITGRAASRAE
jgi:nitroimidazol reductase NimA-like FMN-containing flavoprotein (pyridoxamine 5'-phosphate oxidase superfamily)